MNWVLHKTSSPQPALSLPPPPPPVVHSGLSDRLTPSMLLIIIILAIIFFLSSLLHLLVRFLMRPTPRYRDDATETSVTALQGQLRQLFDLHDSGVDQSFIDTLPVFLYKAIIGPNDQFDCAVCLCEFEPEDKLRLIPKCSHAFHMECIDTWLLSHSTCPLCRANLLHDDFSPKNGRYFGSSPMVVVLESESEASQELVSDPRSIRFDCATVSGESDPKDKGCQEDSREKVMAVKLGKFRNLEGGEGSSVLDNGSANNVDGRRCFSMGSFAYVMDETSALRVPIRTPIRKQSGKKPSLPLTPGHRLAMSECDCESRREFAGFEKTNTEINDGNFKCVAGSEVENEKGVIAKESFSISKIWLRGKKDKPSNSAADASRRAFSFRFPAMGNHAGVGSDTGCDEEDKQSCHSYDSQANAPSLTRRTLLWVLGRQKRKVVHSSTPLENV